MEIQTPPPKTLPRRLFLWLGGLLFLYPLLSFVNFRLPRKPKLLEVNGTLKPGGYLARETIYLFADDTGSWAVSRTCTHLGCRISYKEKEGYLECPCHQSRFSRDGSVLRGPATRHLPVFPVEKKGEPPTYVVTIR